MPMLLCAKRDYIAQVIELVPNPQKPKAREIKYLVMFPDGTGDIFLMDSVSPFLQDAKKRKDYFKAEAIEPAITFKVVDGLLTSWNNTSNPDLPKAIVTFFDDSNSGLGLSYLLAWGYITREWVKADRAAEKFVLGAGQVSMKESAANASREFDAFMDTVRAGAAQILGVPEVKASAKLAPAKAEAPLKSAEPMAANANKPSAKPRKTKNVTPQQTKADLLAIAKSKNVPASKSWTVDQIIQAIAAVDDAVKPALNAEVSIA